VESFPLRVSSRTRKRYARAIDRESEFVCDARVVRDAELAAGDIFAFDMPKKSPRSGDKGKQIPQMDETR